VHDVHQLVGEKVHWTFSIFLLTLMKGGEVHWTFSIFLLALMKGGEVHRTFSCSSSPW
jgi:hypothetical protein